MVGGIIQIASYGTQDLFLTGNPEITFFRLVYRRHTNFSIEAIRVDFNNEVLFGRTSTSIIPKNGDLIHRVYLNVQLPEINFKKGVSADLPNVEVIDDQAVIDDLIGEEGKLTQAIANYYTIDNFIRVNMLAYRKAKAIFDSDNDDGAVDQMISEINLVFDPLDEEGDIDIDARNRIDTIIETFANLLETIDHGFAINTINLQMISGKYDTNSDKNQFMAEILQAINECIIIKKYFYDVMENYRIQLADAQNENLKFAWIDKIGHSIADQIEVEIGGHVIDRQYGDWLNVWHSLSHSQSQDENYRKMIGDVKLLTTFDRNVKPTYSLSIPLQFWFCRYNGLALPLIALEYHDVGINVRFKRFEECCYVENNRLISLTGVGDDLYLDEIGEDEHVPLHAYLTVEYIYLDSDERKRFAQVSHEYLIEQLTTINFEGITETEFRQTIDGIHPCREIIWTVQKDKYKKNRDGFNRCRWDNYSISDVNKGNPATHSTLIFHGYERSPLLTGNYYNYVQPFNYHSATPSDGINIFSFSISPQEYQPSGSANLSRLSNVILNFKIDPKMYEDGNETVTVTVYLRTYNILRFVSGMAGCAYTTR
jgi:hypothetical protein